MINYLQNQRKLFFSGGKLLRAGKLLTLLMLLFAFTGQMKAREVTVGWNDGSNQTLPVTSYAAYSLSQQIYDSYYIGGAGTITKIYYYNTGNVITRDLDIYMTNTTQSQVNGFNGWFAVTEADKVFSGSVTMVNNGEWTEIILDTPFEHDGTNLVVTVDDNTGVAEYGISCSTFYGYQQVLAIYSYDTDIDPTGDMSSYSSSPYYLRNQIKLEIEIPANINPMTDVLDMESRPIGAWKKPVGVYLHNSGDSGTVISIECDNDFFVSETEVPFTMEYNEDKQIMFSTGTTTTPGFVTGNVTITYEYGENTYTSSLELQATAYTPEEGDVWELAKEEIISGPGFSESYQLTGMHDDYMTPYYSDYAKYDYVLKLTVEEEISLRAYASNTYFGGIAVYNEDFSGYPGPDYYYDNDIFGDAGTIFYIPLFPGTYYLVASAQLPDFNVYLESYQMPVPYASAVTYPYDGATGVDNGDMMEFYFGDYSREMKVLVGTQYPPTTVLQDWTSLDTPVALSGLNHNTVYFARVITRNGTGETASPIVPFTTAIDPVEGFAVDNTEIFVGDDAVFTWTTNRAFIGYNIYQDAVKLNDEPITTGTYTVSDLDYNLGGYTFYVTALYEAGESEPSDMIDVFVSGYATLEGYVFEQDGTTPINNIAVTVTGLDEFYNEVVYDLTTDETGKYEATIKAGYDYTIAIDVEEYQPASQNFDIVNYEDELTGINFVLTETYFPVESITVEEDGDNVIVSWTPHGREFQNYRVYRTLADNNGPYSLDNTDVIGTPTETSIVDETWADAEYGIYKYGVSVVYEGNRDGGETPTTLSEGFDEGFPEGWAMFGYHDWMLGSEAGLGYFKGHNYSKDMMISKSYQNGGGITPNNYLVTPRVKFTDISTFSFWACAQDANYPSEHFGVAVSLGSQTYEYDFQMVAEWTMEAKGQGNWYKYTVDLSQFAGEEGYIAIRHFDCYENFYLDIDDVELRNPGITVDGESEIVWSDPIEHNMFVENGVSMKIMLNNGENPVGATVALVNKNAEDQELYPVEDVTLTDDMIVEEYDEVNDITTYYGFFTYETIRKGTYDITITREAYDDIADIRLINEAGVIEYTMNETLLNPDVFTVSSTGWATWYNNDRMFDHYMLSCNGYNYDLTENYMQIPLSTLTEGDTYTCYLYSYYTGGETFTTAQFTYMSCSNFDGVNNLTLTSTVEGNTMNWEYPGTSYFAELVEYDSNGSNAGYYSNYTKGAVLIPTEDIPSNVLTKIHVYDYSGNSSYTNNATAAIYNGTLENLEDLVYTMPLTYTGAGDFVTFDLDEPVTIDPTKNVWIVIERDANSAPNIMYVTNSGTGHTYMYYNAGGYWYQNNSYNLKVRATFGIAIEPEGAVVYRDGDVYDFLGIDETSFVDAGVIDDHVYGVRVVYPNNNMSCVETGSFATQWAFISEGWTWWSPFIEQENYDGLALMELGLGTDGEMIKSQAAGFVAYDEESGEWSGSLTALTNENMYKIKANGDAAVTMFGTVANAANHEITISNGWTWIGFVSGTSMNINTALANLQATEGDMIKSQYGFATYDADGGWFGSLKTLTPGYGYMYKSLNENDVTFVYASNSKGELEENVGADHWMANYNAYPYNMTMIAVVELNDMEVEGDYELAAFANGECRGSVKLIPVMGRYMAFLTVAGDDAAELRFALYNTDTEEEIYGSANVINFTADAMVGDNVNPYVVSFRGTTGLSEMSNSITLYPNPVAKGGQISIMLAEDTESMQVEVLNALGEVVSVETFGQSQVNITMPEIPGVYMVRIVIGNNNTMFRKVVVK